MLGEGTPVQQDAYEQPDDPLTGLRFGHSEDNWSRTRLWMSRDELVQVNTTTLVIVGCGGTGSMLAIYAAYLGFGHLIICEADVLEPSNLNRFIVATPGDVGRPKAHLVADYLRLHTPATNVTVVEQKFPSDAALATLQDSSAIIAGCVDDAKVRIEIDVACRHYGKTLVDLGTGFARDAEGRIAASGGQVMVSRPNGPCLMCLGFPQLINENDYMVGPDNSPQPSLILLNSIVSTLAADCLLQEVANGAADYNVLSYSRNEMSVTAETRVHDSTCTICGEGAEEHIASILGEVD